MQLPIGSEKNLSGGMWSSSACEGLHLRDGGNGKGKKGRSHQHGGISKERIEKMVSNGCEAKMELMEEYIRKDDAGRDLGAAAA